MGGGAWGDQQLQRQRQLDVARMQGADCRERAAGAVAADSQP